MFNAFTRIQRPGLIGGYHVSFGRGVSRIFKEPPATDISTWTHEFGDLLKPSSICSIGRRRKAPAAFAHSKGRSKPIKTGSASLKRLLVRVSIPRPLQTRPQSSRSTSRQRSSP